MFMYLSVYLRCICLAVYLYVCPSVYLYCICLSMYLSVCILYLCVRMFELRALMKMVIKTYYTDDYDNTAIFVYVNVYLYIYMYKYRVLQLTSRLSCVGAGRLSDCMQSV